MVLFNTRKKRIHQRKTTFRKKLYLRNITVLGINDGHDCGAALIRNGKVIAAIQEERLSNIKHHSGVPELSIKEVFKIILDNDIKNAVFHYFDGKVKIAKEIVKEGYFIGINSYIVKSPSIQNVAKEIDLKYLMVETDSPFAPINSEYNEPTNVKFAIQKISELKGIEFQKVEKVVDENTMKFFNLI